MTIFVISTKGFENPSLNPRPLRNSSQLQTASSSSSVFRVKFWVSKFLRFPQMAKRLIPLLNRVLIEKTVPPAKTNSGILLPEKSSKVNLLPHFISCEKNGWLICFLMGICVRIGLRLNFPPFTFVVFGQSSGNLIELDYIGRPESFSLMGVFLNAFLFSFLRVFIQ